MPEKKKVIWNGLQNKGFRLEKRRKHEYLRFHTKDGTKTPVFTYLSHGAGGKEVRDDIIAKMAKQCQLTRKDFLRLVDCSLSADDYEALLLETE